MADVVSDVFAVALVIALVVFLANLYGDHAAASTPGAIDFARHAVSQLWSALGNIVHYRPV